MSAFRRKQMTKNGRGYDRFWHNADISWSAPRA